MVYGPCVSEPARPTHRHIALILARDLAANLASAMLLVDPEGDLVFFNTLRRPFSHVGIYLGSHRFIHAPSRGGKVEIVNMSDVYWTRRYNGARRLLDL